MLHLIKRYSNRKLYDKKDKSYVTLVEIAKLIQKGHEVQVIDQLTRNDITSAILSRIITTSAGEEKNQLPKNVLIDLIQRRGEVMLDYVRKSVSVGVDKITQAGTAVEQKIKGIITPKDKMNSESGESSKVSLNNLASMMDERLKSLKSQISSVRNELAELKSQVFKLREQLDKVTITSKKRSAKKYVGHKLGRNKNG